MSFYDEGLNEALEAGRRYTEQLEKMAQTEREQKRYERDVRRSWIQFWIPLIITNLISVAALIVAILAYVKQ